MSKYRLLGRLSEQQQRDVLEGKAVGCSLDDVVKTTVFLTDLANFEACNEEYARHLTPPYPARSTVQVGLADGLLVEIEAVARRPS